MKIFQKFHNKVYKQLYRNARGAITDAGTNFFDTYL